MDMGTAANALKVMLRLLAVGWLSGLGALPAGSLSEHPPPLIEPENAARLQPVYQQDFGDWNLVTAAAWSADSRWLAVAVSDGVLLLDSQAAFHLAARLEIGSLTHGLAFDASQGRLAAASRDGYIRVWSAAELSAGNTLPLWQVLAHRKGANTVAFSPDGTQIVSGGSDGLARFWQASDGEKQNYIIGGAFATPGLAFLPAGRLAIVNGEYVRLRETTTERILGTFLSEANLYSLAVDGTGTWLAVGGMDDRVRLWRVDQAFKSGAKDYPQPVLLPSAPAPTARRVVVWQISFSPDGRVIAAASGDGSVRLWSREPAQELARLPGYTLGATCASFAPHGGWLATGGLDGRLQIWGAAAP